MSERKVLNKYYPPDFDPSKIPRMKLARNRQYTVRLMAPFNMRCKTCGEYIYKGKKFNARKEDVEGDDYLGIRIYRFYIKCTRCLQEISFKTDPKNTDYEIEAGATRNFMALKLAEEQAQREEDEEKEEEATNPMKLLEKRTLQSKQELELLESLEELKDLNRRQQTIDYDQMLEQFDTEAARQKTQKEQEQADEEYIKSVFGKKPVSKVVVEEEIVELDSSEAERSEPPSKVQKTSTGREERTKTLDGASWSENKSIPVHKAGNKRGLTGLVRKKIDIGIRTVRTEEGKTNVDRLESSEEITRDSDIVDSKSKPVSQNDNSNSNNVNNNKTGLSLLGAYSDTSESDND